MEDRVVIDPGIQHGKPVIRGTRVPVARILAELAGGTSFDDVQRDYGVTLEDIHASLAYARELVEQDEFHPLPGGLNRGV